MPPKANTQRRLSVTSKSASSPMSTTQPDKNVSGSGPGSGPMLPPPDPPQPLAILEPEMIALSGSLKNAVIKTGQIYGFHADSRRLGIHKYAHYPPRSLTAVLGREVEKFDQLCDAMESHLLRAISVLQRDLAREQRRIREAETAAIATRTRSKSSSRSPTSTRIPLPPAAEGGQPSTDVAMLPPPNTPQVSPPPSTAGRRQSTISLSSLHRPPFPLKLDLSSSALRMTAEEAALFSKGLVPSPVSLAPKSARTSTNAEMELMAAFASATAGSSAPHVDIDLTVPENSPIDLTSGMDIGLGSSADKPIELDLDSLDMEMSNMNSDLFGDPPETSSSDAQAAVDSLFSPVTAESGSSLSAAPLEGSKSVKQEHVDLDILSALSTMEGSNQNNDNLFASLDAASHGNAQPGAQTQPDGSGGSSSSSGAHAAPSPGTLLASFVSSSQLESGASNDSGFDLSNLDLSTLPSLGAGFFEGQQETDMDLMDMEELLNMGQGTNTDGQKPNA
ncbi:hypothetical protein BV22DRAFT_59242 [Leucogyrophana mollusca]|uniref:Uncharacterized protein n=1 Tax=Leucogyrophana mollusca TaxID=85980 RepID=A0ACB8BY33_9AGAM|nr:hypothetical protein BV22DRAFT_59242 [Leucogyrophana mollusca]